MKSSEVVAFQRKICDQYGAEFLPSPMEQKVGIARNAKEAGGVPINGLRHRPEGGTTGWYIWAGGEPSPADDFFVPLHVEHLRDWCPSVLPFLGLGPGWRFLLAGDHQDVWFDATLLDV